MSLDANGLADEMTAQLDEAWRKIKGSPFPGGSPADREDAKIMFLAVARGLLLYLEAHKTDMIDSITFGGGSPQSVTSVDVDTFVENVP
ncbi:MAG TPA: hypothetical protein VFY67_09440 [Pyrinomonadaceae bacterium]|nr:hypothetical protein [Pyrinomonadaceae bacterium]